MIERVLVCLLQAHHASEDHHEWNPYVDTRADSVVWEDIEHVGPGMPTTWDVVVGHDNSQNNDAELDMGLHLGLNRHRGYQ